MLKELSIRNFALIKEARVEFSAGFNIITGETGAGKSILLDALGLILGERAESRSFTDNKGKCSVEGCFLLNKANLEELFQEYDLDYEDETIIRREISPNGRSRAFVNDTPVNLNALKEIGSRLIDIHSQHSNLLIKDSKFQYSFLDAMAETTDRRKEYQQVVGSWNSAKLSLAELEEKKTRLLREQDFISFQLQELSEADIQEQEFEQNERELKLLENAERIAENLGEAASLLSNQEPSILDLLATCAKRIEGISNVSELLDSLHSRIQSSLIDLKDVALEAEGYLDELSFDKERVEWLHSRQALLQRLFQKHLVDNTEDLLLQRDKLAEQKWQSEHLEQQIEEAEKKVDSALAQATKLANQLYEERQLCLKPINEGLTEALKKLGIPEAQFSLSLSPPVSGSLGTWGSGELNFLFSANRGLTPDKVEKVASGGEISRIMLSLKAMAASKMSFPSLVFDEIDLGISGEVAIRMGLIIKDLSRTHQVVSITHLPQIAAMADRHFKVSKAVEDDRSFSHIFALPKEDRLVEIGQMIAGDNAGDTALENARELMAQYAD